MTRNSVSTATLPVRTGDGATSHPMPVRSSRRAGTLVVGGLVLLYAFLVVFGVTTSSLGYLTERQNPDRPLGTTIGEPRAIRSDEFSVETPLLFGLAASGSDSVNFPLSEQDDFVSGVPTTGQVFASIVHFDATAMRLGTILPDDSLFAARWWLPWLLLFLGLPAWLRRVGATPQMAWLATALCAAAPATAWWSAFPIRILGFAAAGCALGMAATSAYRRGRWLVGTGQAVLAGLLLSRLATWYIPWSVTLGAPLIVATLCWLLVDRERRRSGLLAIAVAGTVAVILLAGLYWQNWAGLQASMNTVYPGLRRSGGEASPISQIFGAPGEAYFQLGRDVTALNMSELSNSYAIAAIWAAVLFIAAPLAVTRVRVFRREHGLLRRVPRVRADRDTWVVGVLALSTAVLLLWSMVSLGVVGQAIPILNRVPAKRAAETVGFIAVLLVALLLSRRGRPEGWRVPLLAAGASAAVTAYAVSDLQKYAPGIGAPLIVGVSAAVFFVVLTITKEPDRWRWTVAATCLAGLVVGAVNPIQIGSGDLRRSSSAQMMMAAGKEARTDGTYWATDGADTDTLLMATGTPTLSGIQVSGPDVSSWRKLDPRGKYEGAWNRGGASVEFTWLPDGPPVVQVGAPDQIIVQADPCDLVDRGFAVSHVLSQTQLQNACLTPEGTMEWSGRTRYVYSTGYSGT
jgi:hypothetical protein